MNLLRFVTVWRVCVVLVLLVTTNNLAYSQKKIIQFIDDNNQQAVADLYFIYNTSTGFSDNEGKITIDFVEGESLFLSHIRYGKITLNPEQIAEGLKTGVIRIRKSSNYLLPVTLVKVHPGGSENARMDISMQEKLAHDGGNLIESVPGVSTIRKSGAYGFDPVLRGFKYDQIKVVLDGIQTASAACPNRMDPPASQIPLNMISQAQVLKGPYSLRYGNVFGGTINFKSSAPLFKKRKTLLGRLGTSYESNGNVFRTEGVAGVNGQKADIRFFGSYSKGDDYTDGDAMKVAADFNRLNWGGKFGFQLGPSQTLGVLVSNNVAKDVDFPSLPMDLREDNTWLVNVSHSALFYNKKLASCNTSIYGTMVDHLMNNYDKLLDPRNVDAETEANTTNYGGRTELRFDFSNSFLYTGLDYRVEAADGYRTRKMLMGPKAGKVLTDNVWQDAKINRTGIFGEYHLNSTGYQFVFSGRMDVNRSIAHKPDEDFLTIYNNIDASQVHASLSAGGTKLFSQTTSLGLFLGRAMRSAGITERYINQFPVGLDPYEMLGNPELAPEVNTQIDLIFQYEDAKTNVSVNFFSSFLRDYISSEIRDDIPPAMPSAPGVRQYININKAVMRGFEIGWKQQLAQSLSHNLTMAYTYGENQVLNEPLAEIPPFEFVYRLSGSYLKNKLQPELIFSAVAQQNRIATSYGETKSPGFNVFDAKVSYSISKVVSTSAGVLNILDTAYYEHLARSVRNANKRPIYSPGRSFYLTLTCSFL